MSNGSNTLLINLISNKEINAGKALRTGRKFLAADWQVVLSMNIDAVKLLDPVASSQLCPVAGKPLVQLLKTYQADGGRVLVGAECLSLAGLSAENLFPGMELASFPLLEEILARPNVRTMTW